MEGDVIAQFTEITGSNPELATQYLQLADFNIEQAMQLYFENGGAPLTEEPRQNSHTSNYEDESGIVHIDSDSDDDPDILISPRPQINYVTQPARSSADEDYRLQLARKVVRKWMRHAGLHPNHLSMVDGEGEFTPPWTSGISPRLEGRIILEGPST